MELTTSRAREGHSRQKTHRGPGKERGLENRAGVSGAGRECREGGWRGRQGSCDLGPCGFRKDLVFSVNILY